MGRPRICGRPKYPHHTGTSYIAISGRTTGPGNRTKGNERKENSSTVSNSVAHAAYPSRDDSGQQVLLVFPHLFFFGEKGERPLVQVWERMRQRDSSQQAPMHKCWDPQLMPGVGNWRRRTNVRFQISEAFQYQISQFKYVRYFGSLEYYYSIKTLEKKRKGKNFPCTEVFSFCHVRDAYMADTT
ncbi:hypothetical protein METBIDRAFT_97598 [Metschnikowia bicuspidata var. bicuspidata NRRL YB-4993]|uniref:Uncharacterized protein n=1 Tax=Metschnikowia bicuspidata var. bicuspidata NRRL YB-4993 TaxID=869754 RepID=A0A1A0HGF7_9ASCO|nr:hypothetical protein METBIDRAFT_97598 [Metschnikowia bicuspidata var. bicuspidata NRRL YB-4993]OBA23075.1 hypothetical protein METBIDRAFT_97598 [Metschnikowia bicuspidata var. bicuspidata NRRL YB-4993]